MSQLKKLAFLSCAALISLEMSCGNDSTTSLFTNNPTEGLVRISVKTTGTSSLTTLSKLFAAPTITRAQVVIDEIEFESNNGDTLDFELEEPFVQDLTLDTSLQVISSINLPFGTYDEMEVEIDELDNENSPAYVQNPDLRNLSIRVEGLLEDGSSFVFTSDLSEEQEREISPPLIIDETSPATNVTLTIDLATWFVDSNGNPVDPTVEDNRSLIERNIKASIEVFEDEDEDGERDDDDEQEDDDD